MLNDVVVIGFYYYIFKKKYLIQILINIFFIIFFITGLLPVLTTKGVQLYGFDIDTIIKELKQPRIDENKSNIPSFQSIIILENDNEVKGNNEANNNGNVNKIFYTKEGETGRRRKGKIVLKIKENRPFSHWFHQNDNLSDTYKHVKDIKDYKTLSSHQANQKALKEILKPYSKIMKKGKEKKVNYAFKFHLGIQSLFSNKNNNHF